MTLHTNVPAHLNVYPTWIEGPFLLFHFDFVLSHVLNLWQVDEDHLQIRKKLVLAKIFNLI